MALSFGVIAAQALTLVLSFGGAILATRLAVRTGHFGQVDPAEMDSMYGRVWSRDPGEERPRSPFLVFLVSLFVLLVVFSVLFDALLVR